MAVHRRELLRGIGGLAACTWIGCGREDETFESAALVLEEPGFVHGVASGDPLPDAVILWTRLTPSFSEPGPFSIEWEIATDAQFDDVVARGETRTSAERDYTIKVDASGLSAATTYYYRFTFGNARSPIGRTRTAPSGAVDRLRFAVAACSSYAHGYFHAYRAIAARPDLDAVIHLGDYMYEYATGEYGDVRAYDPLHEILTLEDYRRRYAQYRRDPDLQAVHQQFPMITIWDDHEVANNAWITGAKNHNPAQGEGDFSERKRAAMRTYFEWMPIRDTEDQRGFRKLQFGDLVDLVMLDTRHWGREKQVGSRRAPDFEREDRQLLGEDQEQWLASTLQQSKTCWRLIGQQLVVGPAPLYFNYDAWAGYPAARERFLALLAEHASKDTVVLAGDVHASWVMNLMLDPYDSEAEPVAVEFVTPGISSPGLERNVAERRQAELLEEPHVEYVQLWRRGYVLLDITAERVQAEYYHFDAVESPEPAAQKFAGAFATYAGEHRVRKQDEAAEASVDAPALAPAASSEA